MITLRVKGFYFLLAIGIMQPFAIQSSQSTITKTSSPLESLQVFYGKHPYAITSILVLTILAKLYHENKKPLTDEQLSDEEKESRWQEILDSENPATLLRLLVKYLDDFYVFGRSSSVKDAVDVFIKDGREIKIKTKVVTRKGYGIVPWMHDKIFSKLKDMFETSGNITALTMALILCASGSLPILKK